MADQQKDDVQNLDNDEPTPEQIAEFEQWSKDQWDENGMRNYHFDFSLPVEKWSTDQALYYLQKRTNTLSPDGEIVYPTEQEVAIEMLELRHNLFGVVKRQLVEKVEAKQSMSDQEYLTYLVLDKQINDLKILEKANDLSQKILQQVKKPVGVIAKYLVENNVENFHFEIICKDANNKILFHF